MAKILDRKRYECLFDKALLFREDLYRILRARIGNPQDAEDLTQETYLRFYNRVVNGGFCPVDIRNYLFKIGINQSNSLFEKKRKRLESVYENSEDLAIYDPEKGYKEDLEFLQENLGEMEFSFLLNLIGPSRLEKVALSGIIDQDTKGLELLKTRLSELYDRYSRDGKIVLPPKEIIRVEFNPLSIRFRARYDKDPLRFFQQHNSVYGSLSRLELSKFDQSLYNALRRTNKISEAIPLDMRSDKDHGLSVEEQKRIVSTFESCQSSARATSQVLPYSPQTILKYCKRKGVEVRNRKGILESEREEIIGAYEKYNGVVFYAAKALGRSRKLVSEVWRDDGLEISSNRGIELLKKMRGQQSLSDKKSKKIVEIFEKCSGVISRASKSTGHSAKTIKKYWKEAGLI